jgi:protein-tyrosine phosphatase
LTSPATGSPPSDEGVKYLRVPIKDNILEDLRAHLPAAFSFIRQAKREKGRILVHCYAGISRAPAVVLAYGIRYLGWKAEEDYK